MNELTELKLEEVSLVAEGANPEAKILLYKSKDKPADKPSSLTERIRTGAGRFGGKK